MGKATGVLRLLRYFLKIFKDPTPKPLVSFLYSRTRSPAMLNFRPRSTNIVEQIARWTLFAEREREEGAVVVLVGNKCDLKQRRMDKFVMERMMAEYNASYVETSAKTGFNVDHLFSLVAHSPFPKHRKSQSAPIRRSLFEGGGRNLALVELLLLTHPILIKTQTKDGERILDLAVAHDLVICSTFFVKTESQKVTYARGGRRMEVDHILVRRIDLKTVRDVKVLPGEEVASQHRPLVADLNIPLQI
ncbi:unnamed protein product [Heligmosomoides polygyrus]|uniref:ANK_REP_REGION domain-containing protein n=1 Tax=Heligmosomoides polygyrus TaxID=6339 RepID=A0A183G2N9_HELPZ|nr:unnamed protein product [Heligmosomoides polygyrus]